MTVTESGILILFKLVQSLNAESPISVTELGMTTSPPLPLYSVKTPSSITKSLLAANTSTGKLAHVLRAIAKTTTNAIVLMQNLLIVCLVLLFIL